MEGPQIIWQEYKVLSCSEANFFMKHIKPCHHYFLSMSLPPEGLCEASNPQPSSLSLLHILEGGMTENHVSASVLLFTTKFSGNNCF